MSNEHKLTIALVTGHRPGFYQMSSEISTSMVTNSVGNSKMMYHIKLYSVVILSTEILFTGISSCKAQVANSPKGMKKNLSDDALLTLVKKQTFQYFWDGAEPNSGLARERYHSDNIYPQNDKHVVATFKRLKKGVDFLEKAELFHGAWPHWIDGNTGKAKPFSKDDDGADLVETAYLAQGLLCVRQYSKLNDIGPSPI